MNASRVGIFVDCDAMAAAGGYGMRYDVLRRFAARKGGEVIRLNAYAPTDPDRTEEEAERAVVFRHALRDFGYRVVDGGPTEMAVDALLESDRLDRVLLGATDPAFGKVAAALQNRGIRVEALQFQTPSEELNDQADTVHSGFLIPNLLPASGSEGEWGEDGSRVRGLCYSFSHDRDFGFLRVLIDIDGDFSRLDTRAAGSPYRSAFAHASEFEDYDIEDLPTRDAIFEFTITKTERGLQAKQITTV